MRNVYILWLIFIATGCAVIKESPNDNLRSLQETDYTKLNGNYGNYPTQASRTWIRDESWRDREFKSASLWSQLQGFTQSELLDSLKTQTVSIEFLSQKKAIAKLWANGIMKERRKIRGK